MNRVSQVIVAAISLAAAGGALAAEITLETPKGCGIVPLKDRASDTQVERTDKRLIFTVRANAYCGVQPGTPQISRHADIAKVSVTYDVSKAVHNCFCARTIRFSISYLWPGIRTIYYIQDGQVTGHGDVP